MRNIRNYWAPESKVDQIADVMTRNEFEIIKNALHFCDNDNFTVQSPKDFKFRSILENFNAVANKLTIDEHFSVDEQIIPTKTKKTSLRQYIPSKPKKWGFKMFLLTSSQGLIHNVEFYTGAREDNNARVGVAGPVVLRLVEILPENSNIKFFFDNWFSSVELIDELSLRGF